jgi:hypothetical protein
LLQNEKYFGNLKMFFEIRSTSILLCYKQVEMKSVQVLRKEQKGITSESRTLGNIGGRHSTVPTGEVRLEMFMAMKIQVAVFWVVTPCSDVVGYHFNCAEYIVMNRMGR